MEGYTINTKKPNRVPVTDYESQPRVPHHRAYGSVRGGFNQTRASGTSRICIRCYEPSLCYSGTPTPKSSTRLARVYKLIDILALNVLKAKQK